MPLPAFALVVVHISSCSSGIRLCAIEILANLIDANFHVWDYYHSTISFLPWFSFVETQRCNLFLVLFTFGFFRKKKMRSGALLNTSHTQEASRP